LPLLFGEATKFSSFLLDADKEYLADVRLGVARRRATPKAKCSRRSAVEVDDAASKPRWALSRRDRAGAADALRAQVRRPPLYEMARQGGHGRAAPRRIAIRETRTARALGGLLRSACVQQGHLRARARRGSRAALGTGRTLRAEADGAGCFRIEQAVALAPRAMESAAESDCCCRWIAPQGLPPLQS
jgi:tRNA pseudouridine55 synthase